MFTKHFAAAANVYESAAVNTDTNNSNKYIIIIIINIITGKQAIGRNANTYTPSHNKTLTHRYINANSVTAEPRTTRSDRFHINTAHWWSCDALFTV